MARSCTILGHRCLMMCQVLGNPIAARTASVIRYGSTVADQMQALTSRTGKSFAGGLRLKPKNIGINFSELKKQVCLFASMIVQHEQQDKLLKFSWCMADPA